MTRLTATHVTCPSCRYIARVASEGYVHSRRSRQRRRTARLSGGWQRATVDAPCRGSAPACFA